MEALKDFPGQEIKLETEKGLAFCQKADIFKGILWYSYREDPSTWHALTKEQVHQIMENNKSQKKVLSLEEYAAENKKEDSFIFENAVGQDSLTRFDRPRRKRKKKKGKNSKNTGKSQLRNA